MPETKRNQSKIKKFADILVLIFLRQENFINVKIVLKDLKKRTLSLSP